MPRPPTDATTSAPLEVPVQGVDDGIAPPVVFVSYAHETPEHKRWVKSLASDLRRNGVNALLDEWKVAPGEDFTLFMEQIRASDRVLLVCTPTYARKANEGEGGVGYERSVVTAELAKSIDTTKFVCVLRDGEPSDAIPIFAQSRRFLDFREDSEYDIHLEALLRALHKASLDPEPALGPNPFAKIPSDDPKGVEPPPSHLGKSELGTPESLIEQAANILSRRDMVGWKRLVRTARRKFETAIVEWRASLSPQDVAGDAWLKSLDRGVQVAEPLFALALSAIDSEIEPIHDQFGMIDVILSLERWERAGYVAVIEIPRAIAYLYHELIGAIHIHLRQHADAIRLLTTKIRDDTSSKVKPLYNDHEMMGYVRSLDGNCLTTWKYVVELYDSRRWLGEFFPSKREFIDSYRAYNLLASLLELGAYLKGGGDIKAIESRNFWLDVPPMFLHPINDRGSTFDEIVNIAVPNEVALLQIERATGCPLKILREAWPMWYGALLRSLGGCRFDLLAHRLSGDPAPVLPG